MTWVKESWAEKMKVLAAAMNNIELGISEAKAGSSSLVGKTSGSGTTAVVALGTGAGEKHTTGTESTYLGYKAGQLDETGNGFGKNTAVGWEALAHATAGYSVGVGSRALAAVTTAEGNTGIGCEAGQNLTTNGENTAVGCEALGAQSSEGGAGNDAYGFKALHANTKGEILTAIGRGAMYENTTGNYNTACGNKTMEANKTGNHNTAIGAEALNKATKSSNAALGSQTLKALEGGEKNVGLGQAALTLLKAGSENVAIGYLAGGQLLEGGNIFIGNQAGYTKTTTKNTLIIANNETTPLIEGTLSGTLALGFKGAAPVAFVSESLATGTLKTTKITPYGFETEAQALAVIKFAEKFSKWAHEAGLTA